MKSTRERCAIVEREANAFRSERQALESTLSKQGEELERRRRDASHSEAKVFEIMQDRNDAQVSEISFDYLNLLS
jgi:hypothetical protein